MSNSGLLYNDNVELTFVIGNKHKKFEKIKPDRYGKVNDHQWTAFVKLEDGEHYEKDDLFKLVSHVTFALPENEKASHLNPVVRVNTKANDTELSLTKVSGGFFAVPITIHFRIQTGLPEYKTRHLLSFDGKGKCHRI